MFVDGSGKDRSADGTESADICIIGGGAAGITLACELADGSHRVILIESGGLNSQTSDRGSYRVSAGERVTVGLVPSMPSYFGGATNYGTARIDHSMRMTSSCVSGFRTAAGQSVGGSSTPITNGPRCSLGWAPRLVRRRGMPSSTSYIRRSRPTTRSWRLASSRRARC